jgi:dynein heavy chain
MLLLCSATLQALADIVGFEIKRDEVTSLRRLLDQEIGLHLPKVTELSDQASRSVCVWLGL